MIKENQFVNQELSHTSEQRNARTKELEIALNRLASYEELAATKEQEKNDILGTYRALCAEVERLKLTNVEVQEERGQYRQQISVLQEHIARLETHVQALRAEREQSLIDLEAFEHQNELVSRQLESTQKQLQQALHQGELMSRDVTSAREVSYALGGKRDDLIRELAEAKKNIKSLQLNLSTVTNQAGAYKARLEVESNRCSQLEALLSGLRVKLHEKEDQIQLGNITLNDTSKAMAAENQLLKERIEGLEEQLQTHSHYREKQASEIKGLLRTMTHSLRLSPTNTSVASEGESDEFKKEADKVSQTKDKETVFHALNTKVDTLQATVSEQFQKIKDLHEEKAKLKTIALKYESELVKQVLRGVTQETE